MQEKHINTWFIAPIVYFQPRFEELQRRFPAHLSPDYLGKHFNSIERCKFVSMQSRKVTFEYVCMNRIVSIDEVLAEIDRRGLRPALYEELVGLVESRPDEQWDDCCVVALGSETSVNGYRKVAILWHDGDGQNLDLCWIGENWGEHDRFLAVRK